MDSKLAPNSIRPLNPDDAKDATFVLALTDMINQVYREAEEGLLRDDVPRTYAEEITSNITAGNLHIAVSQSGALMGCVRLMRDHGHRSVDIDLRPASGYPAEDVAVLGMLAVPAEYRRYGLGRKLLEYGENLARERGFRVLMIELITPREGPHRFKDFLRVWYEKLGFEVVKQVTLEDFLPHKPGVALQDCDVLISKKVLSAA